MVRGMRWIVTLLILAGCAAPPTVATVPTETATITATTVMTAAPSLTSTAAPTAPSPSPTQTTAPTATHLAPMPLSLWVDPALPAGFQDALALPAAIRRASQPEAANLRLEIGAQDQAGQEAGSYWVYAAVAPFPTITDEVSLDAIKAAWQGQPGEITGGRPLLMSAETALVLESWWGRSAVEGARVLEADDLLDAAWQEMPALAVIPFEHIQPRWKVLRVDGQSPLQRNFTPGGYGLAVPIRLEGNPEARAALPEISLPTNRDPEKLTVLVMTGVTALTRNLAIELEKKGVLYPLEEIGPWLAEADLTHFSNEVSFHSGCPTPARGRGNQRFCSDPKYIQLLEAAGADIIELTGNHNLDWGPGPYWESIDLYRQRGWMTYGGGWTLTDARQPALLEHNGTRLAFLGCNRAGPVHTWATETSPGSAPCQMDLLEKQVQQLAADGWLPIVTIQAFETEGYAPSVAQGMPDFRRAARAGAVIVSGSQSHYPQTMTFIGDRFIHYGLGNLFFDQMGLLAYRQNFIDRHFFYNGKYLGVELLTTLTEELGRPRPMTGPEREKLLQTIFELSNWMEK